MYTRLILLDDIPEIQRAEVGKGIPVPMVAATGGLKGDGYDLAGLPWDFSRAHGRGAKAGSYRYPMLWVHDYAGENFPFGVVDVAEREKGGPTLDGDAIFNPEYDRAVTAEKMYRSPVGGLKGFSVSWEDIDEDGIPARVSGKKPVAHQLYEISAVPIGMDALALAKDGGARVASLRALVADLDAALSEAAVTGGGANQDVVISEVTETETTFEVDLNPENIDAIARLVAVRLAQPDNNAPPDDGEDSREIAGRMVAIMDCGTNEPDADRKRKYNALKPAYARLGWIMPEFVPGAELRIMDPDVWRELFVSGELARAGKEFSAANMTELGEILSAIEAGAKRLRGLVDRVAGKGAGDGQQNKQDTERTTEQEEDELAAMLRSLAAELGGGVTE